MNIFQPKFVLLSISITMALLLSACGGGSSLDFVNDGNDTPTNTDNDDTTNPVISLNGLPTMNVVQGAIYVEAGATVTDNIDDDITVEITGSVVVNTFGPNVLTYTATDTAGNSSSVERKVQVVNANMYDFYTDTIARDMLEPSYAESIEAFIYAQDKIIAGDYAEARAIIDDIFAKQPLSTPIWSQGVRQFGLHAGNPVAYAGLRMLDVIASAGDIPTTGTLQMTAVVAPCAIAERPTLPDLEIEVVRVSLDPEILANNSQILHESTDVFRRWVKVITGGLEVELVVHENTECSNVGVTIRDNGQGGGPIISYPDRNDMVDEVPEEIAASTDFWWVVTPSGVPGDGSGFNRTFITGGMGSRGTLPLFISDDGWFTRKPSHLGLGRYSPIERRAYQPQWFQHEFMHHLFNIWPEFGLEDAGHQWFDRSTWPADFVGINEPDYYAEAIEKRLMTATPSLAEGLMAPPFPIFLNLEDLPLSILEGQYQRLPVENGFHDVTVTVVDNQVTWSNAAGVSWPLMLIDGGLLSSETSPYGEREFKVELEPIKADDGSTLIKAIQFLNSSYIKID